MNSFKVVAIPTEVAQYVRATGKSPVYGFPAHKETAAGRAPCRHCLELIREQKEELLLFTYDPFREVGAPPLPGPVYVHAEECPRHHEDQLIPANYQGRKLTFDAYDADGALLKAVFLSGGGEEEIANRLFADQSVQYIHVRSTEAGCFLFRLQRA
jgi:hypothetical protein